MFSVLMLLFVIATVVVGIVISGVGFGPYVSIESLVLMVVAPLAMLGIGVPPGKLVRAFQTAFYSLSASETELKEARVILRGWGRLIAGAAALYAGIGLIAILKSVSSELGQSLWWMADGAATMALSAFYAILLHVLLVSPLQTRVDRVLAATE
jgi:hypothetical protein